MTVITAGDMDVLRLCASGLTNQAIAHKLNLPFWTVRKRIEKWMLLYNAPNRTALVVLAHQDRRIDLDSVEVKR